MRIYAEATKGNTQLIEVELKEANIFLEVFEEYCKNNKRKKIAKKILTQMEKELGVGL